MVTLGRAHRAVRPFAFGLGLRCSNRPWIQIVGGVDNCHRVRCIEFQEYRIKEGFSGGIQDDAES